MDAILASASLVNVVNVSLVNARWKMKAKITKKTKFSELMKNPEAVEILMNKGMHCFGCPFSQVETLEQGAKSHGLDVDELVEEINKKKGSQTRSLIRKNISRESARKNV